MQSDNVNDLIPFDAGRVYADSIVFYEHEIENMRQIREFHKQQMKSLTYCINRNKAMLHLAKSNLVAYQAYNH